MFTDTKKSQKGKKKGKKKESEEEPTAEEEEELQRRRVSLRPHRVFRIMVLTEPSHLAYSPSLSLSRLRWRC